MPALDSFARPKLPEIVSCDQKSPLTVPKHKFGDLKNLGSWSNYRGSLPDGKENGKCEFQRL